MLNDQAPGYSYSRIDNPTVDGFARAVAALEGANMSRWPAAQGFASGMGAISGVFWTYLRSGAHVVCSSAVYGGTYSLLRNVLSRFGVETDFVDMADLDAVRATMRSTTRIVYAETIANPTTAIPDLRKLADIAHDRGALLVVDSTLAPPVICRPLEHGADLVIHSATKYIGGHSDVTGGVVTGQIELISQIRAVRVDTGGSLSPDDAVLLRRGIETLPIRVRRQCATAAVFAATLARHPAVLRVDYPGLPTHPQHDLARRLFDIGPEGVRFGAVVTVTPFGGRDAGFAFADKLRLAKLATSLGGTHPLVSHVASTTHRQMDDGPGSGWNRLRCGSFLHRPGGLRGPHLRRVRGPGVPRPLARPGWGGGQSIAARAAPVAAGLGDAAAGDTPATLTAAQGPEGYSRDIPTSPSLAFSPR